MGTKNRVPCNQKSNTNERDVSELDNNVFLPNNSEQNQQKNDYKTLIGRVITSNIPGLEFLKSVSVTHIPHKYSDLTSKPTETVKVILRFFYIN